MTSKLDADFDEALASSEVATKAKLANAAEAPKRVLEELKADSARANAFSVDIADLPARDVEPSERKEHVIAVPPSSASPRLPSRRIVVPESDRANITLPDAHRIAVLQAAGEVEGGPTVGGGTLRVRTIDTSGDEQPTDGVPSGSIRGGRWLLAVAIAVGAALALYLAVSLGARTNDRAAPSAATSSSLPGIEPTSSASMSELPSSAPVPSTIRPSATPGDAAIPPPATTGAAPPIFTPAVPPTAPRPGATPWFD